MVQSRMRSAIFFLSICGVGAFNVPSALSPTSLFVSREMKHQNRFSFEISAENNENDRDKYEDPNPGGMSNWGKEDTSDSSGGNFLSVITDWLSSEEGKEDVASSIF